MMIKEFLKIMGVGFLFFIGTIVFLAGAYWFYDLLVTGYTTPNRVVVMTIFILMVSFFAGAWIVE